MFNGYVRVIVTLGLFLILDLVIPFDHVFAQANQNKENAILAPINKMLTTGASTNSTGIMQNTSGIIDDAIDAIKNSLGSLFRK